MKLLICGIYICKESILVNVLHSGSKGSFQLDKWDCTENVFGFVGLRETGCLVTNIGGVLKDMRISHFLLVNPSSHVISWGQRKSTRRVDICLNSWADRCSQQHMTEDRRPQSVRMVAAQYKQRSFWLTTTLTCSLLTPNIALMLWFSLCCGSDWGLNKLFLRFHIFGVSS